MTDFLYRGSINELDVRFSYGLCTTLVNSAVLAHNSDPLSAHILGRALTAGVLLSPLLTQDERFTIRWNYDGAVKSIVVDVGANADIHGFVAPGTLSELVESEGEIYGDNGRVSVTRSTSKKIINSGTAEAKLMDVVDDLSLFYSISDQIETALLVMIGFNQDVTKPVSLCHGFMLQAMPGCDLNNFESLRTQFHGPEMRTLMSSIQDIDNYFEFLLKSLLAQHKVVFPKIHESPQPRFECRCNRQKVLEITQTLSPGEIDELVANKETLKITCQFCSRVYEIGGDEIKSFLMKNNV